MRKFAKVDSNHKEIIDGLRKCGYSVVSLASIGGGVPDLLVGLPAANILLEIKDGKKSPSQRRLTVAQVGFFESWRGPKFKIETIEEALEILKRFKQ